MYDVLGYVQTLDSHEAVMKKLHFDNGAHQDLSERYLWALSMCSQPNPDIILDILDRYRKLVNIPEKVKETMVLTMAAMASRLRRQSTMVNAMKVSFYFYVLHYAAAVATLIVLYSHVAYPAITV